MSQNKTVVMLVYGEGDYGAMTFDKNYNYQQVYEQMVAEGVTEKTIIHNHPMHGEEELYVELSEFESIDPSFVDFLVNEYFLDYDELKARNFYFVEVAE